MFSLKVLGYLKEKRVRNDNVFYTCGQSLEKEDALSTVEQGYVMKNDPFRKERLLSSKEVLIEKGKLLDEQIKCRDCGKIIQSSGNTKNIDICKRRILPGTSSIKDMFQIRKILLANSLNAIEN